MRDLLDSRERNARGFGNDYPLLTWHGQQRSSQRIQDGRIHYPIVWTVSGPCQGSDTVRAFGHDIWMPEQDVRKVAAANLKALAAFHKCRRNRGGVWRHEDIADAAGVGKGTVGRIARAEIGTSIDNLDAVAQVFSLRAWQLLIPDLKPEEPFVAYTDSQLEADTERRFDSYVQALAKLAQGIKAPTGPSDGSVAGDLVAHRQDSSPKPAPKRRRN